jgi:hypothetical protein
MDSVGILLRDHVDMTLKDYTLHVLATRGCRLADDDVSDFVLDGLKTMGHSPVIHIFHCKFLVL